MSPSPGISISLDRPKRQEAISSKYLALVNDAHPNSFAPSARSQQLLGRIAGFALNSEESMIEDTTFLLKRYKSYSSCVDLYGAKSRAGTDLDVIGKRQRQENVLRQSHTFFESREQSIWTGISPASGKPPNRSLSRWTSRCTLLYMLKKQRLGCNRHDDKEPLAIGCIPRQGLADESLTPASRADCPCHRFRGLIPC